ncbi:NTP transferase domain-containing protein [bacterium]|nr:NTP transferase domain-containing protein [bacterium]
MADLTILIPAAGASTRMRGTDKLLIPIDGVPLLRRTALTALATHPAVLVTLRPGDAARAAVLHGLPLATIEIPQAHSGLSVSLRGAAAAIDRGCLMILPADMPDLAPDDLARVIAAGEAAPDAIIRATAEDGTPGHPVLFPADLLPAFAHLTGDEGARSILQAHKDRIRLIPLPEAHALTDLDTPEAWAAWRQAVSKTRTS